MDRLVAFRRDVAQAGDGAARARWDQATHDDVLLQALQHVDLAIDRRVGEDPRGFLEGGRREDRTGLQRRLGDAQEDGAAFGGPVALVRRLLVGDFQFQRIDMLTGDQRGFAAIGDF